MQGGKRREQENYLKLILSIRQSHYKLKITLQKSNAKINSFYFALRPDPIASGIETLLSLKVIDLVLKLPVIKIEATVFSDGQQLSKVKC